MPTRRRFAIVSPNLYPRVCGVGDHSFRVGQELIRRGHEVELFSRAPAESHPEAPDLRAHGVPGATPVAIMAGLDRELETFRPDVVILQYTSQMWDAWRFGSPAVPRLARRLRKRGVPVILLAHELFVPFLRRPDLAAAAVLQRAQMLALLGSVDEVFVTTGTRAKIIAPFCRVAGAPPPRIVRIAPNATPVARRGPEPPGSFRIGHFSTAGVGKRFDVVLDAFRLVAQRVADRNLGARGADGNLGAELGADRNLGTDRNLGAELVLIGDLGARENPRVREIEAWVAAHPARDRIRMTGKLSLEQVAEEMARLDLYVFSMDTGANSRSGTLPLALGTGLPVVAFRGRETDPELFRDGENVVFARDMTGPAFADAILRLIEDPAARERIGAAARRVYEHEMSWPRTVDDLLASPTVQRALTSNARPR